MFLPPYHVPEFLHSTREGERRLELSSNSLFIFFALTQSGMIADTDSKNEGAGQVSSDYVLNNCRLLSSDVYVRLTLR